MNPVKLNRLAVQNVFSSNFSGEVQAVKFVNNLLELAVQEKASDVHIEPLEQFTRVRLRIDGILRNFGEVPRSNHNSIVSRIKILSSLDIAEKRLPQDGRVEVQIDERRIDLRVSTLPVIDGEKIVIRLLDKTQHLLDLDNLDLNEDNLKSYRKIINANHGMVLITGPTGSGKSTTLYATLQQLNTVDKNIITIEDPIEYKIAGVNQLAVSQKIGLTFAKGLRSIVRQDPNIIMVGEIRDEETARIAVQAALTGHLVFSTLHTNSAVGAITRLLDIGIEPYLLAAALRGVVAQRLVRRICLHCRRQYSASAIELNILGRKPEENINLYEGTGCEFCNGTGYTGRLAVQEVLDITPALQNLIAKGSVEESILEVAKADGFRSLAWDCQEKILAGHTTVAEMLRAVYG